MTSTENIVDVNLNPCCNGKNILNVETFCVNLSDSNQMKQDALTLLACEPHDIILFNPEIDESSNFTVDNNGNLHLFYSFLDKEEHLIPSNE